MGLTRRQGRQPRAAAAKGKGKAGKKARAAGAAGANTKSGGGGGGGGALRKRLAQDVYDYGSVRLFVWFFYFMLLSLE